MDITKQCKYLLLLFCVVCENSLAYNGRNLFSNICMLSSDRVYSPCCPIHYSALVLMYGVPSLLWPATVVCWNILNWEK